MTKSKKSVKNRLLLLLFALPLILVQTTLFGQTYANTSNTPAGRCGSGTEAVNTSIDLGCTGDQCITDPSASYCTATPGHNPIIDMTFAILRLISDGVGLLIIASLIFAGIQYTFSRGEPQAAANATRRIQSSATALLIFILAYALLNYVVPNGLFGQ